MAQQVVNFNGTGGTQIQLVLDVDEQSTNVSANTSVVRYRLRMYRYANNGFRYYNLTGTASYTHSLGLSGNYNYDFNLGVGSYVTIVDTTRTVAHATNGTGSASASATANGGTTPLQNTGVGAISQTLTNFPEPAAGSLSSSLKTDSTARIQASVSTNGNGTSTTLTFYYKLSTNGSYTNAGTGTLKNLTGLTSNATYNWYVKAVNNTGNSSQTSTQTFYTLPAAPVLLTPTTITSSRAVVPTTQSNGASKYAITKQYRFKEVGGSDGTWTTYTGNDILLENLSPYTEYEVETRSTTTAGTTTGGTITFTTKRVSGNFLPLMMG